MSLLGLRTIKVGELTFQVNPKTDIVKVKLGDKKTKISRQELWSFVFTITGPEQQEKMLPVRKAEMMKFKKVHEVEIMKDMKAGERLKFSCLIDVPTRVIEGMQDMIREKVPLAIPALEDLKVIPRTDSMQDKSAGVELKQN